MSNLLFGFDWINWIVVLFGLLVLTFLVWIGAIKISEKNRAKPYPIGLAHWFVHFSDGMTSEIEWKEHFNNKMLYKFKCMDYPVAVIEGLHVWSKNLMPEESVWWFETVLNSDGTVNHAKLEERRIKFADSFNEWKLSKVEENVLDFENKKMFNAMDKKKSEMNDTAHAEKIIEKDVKPEVEHHERELPRGKEEQRGDYQAR